MLSAFKVITYTRVLGLISFLYISFRGHSTPNACCVCPLQFGMNGMHIITCLVWLKAKMATAPERFKFSL